MSKEFDLVQHKIILLNLETCECELSRTRIVTELLKKHATVVKKQK